MQTQRGKADGGGPVVLCVVIHWGRLEDTSACVHSLLTQTGVDFRVMVLDNGTGHDVAGALEGTGVRIEKHPVNSGFTGGVNRAMDLARAEGAEWCWLLNNDTLMETPAVLRDLLAFAQAGKATVVSPVLRNVTGNRARESGWSLFFPGLALTLADTGSLLSTHLKHIARYQRFISGTAWLVRVAATEKPFLDPAFFAYFEDVDLALRIGETRMAVAPAVSLTHHVSRSTGGSLLKFRYKATNLVYLMHKHRLARRGFLLRYALCFVASESRHYWRQPLRFLGVARDAWIEGLEKSKKLFVFDTIHDRLSQ